MRRLARRRDQRRADTMSSHRVSDPEKRQATGIDGSCDRSDSDGSIARVGEQNTTSRLLVLFRLGARSCGHGGDSARIANLRDRDCARLPSWANLLHARSC